MRTDGATMAGEAIFESRKVIEERFVAQNTCPNARGNILRK